MKNISIRKYQKQDLNAVLQILKSNTPTYFSPQEEKEFIHYLENEIEQYFVVELNNQIVACGGINLPENKNIGVISWGMVRANYQGMNIGKQLLNHRIKVLQSIPTVNQIIVRTSQLVFPFYEKCGFKLIETIENYWAEGFHLYKMEYQNKN